MSKRLVVWLWLSVASVVVGAYLLYPIGSTGMNVLFFLWKAGMLSGLLSLLAGSKRWGFVVWAVLLGRSHRHDLPEDRQHRGFVPDGRQHCGGHFDAHCGGETAFLRTLFDENRY
ncbi:MAG: hypothetical protein LKE39_01650 [Sphaerochaeta sp.]|jgi:hypothetical protein|nr:hypothetical protein [Sphaerochaeta sp.]